ncbi:hypothetical protein H0N98_03600 [Candidatus Micrarchaeota archaeon]|nr:hypothetical protein [Candidatus Micrarchaeota archaeon]
MPGGVTVAEKLKIDGTELKQTDRNPVYAVWEGAREFGEGAKGSTRVYLHIDKKEEKLTASLTHWKDDKRTDVHAEFNLTGKLVKLGTTSEVFSNVAEWLKVKTEAEGGITNIDCDTEGLKADVKKFLKRPEVQVYIPGTKEAAEEEKRLKILKRKALGETPTRGDEPM